MTIRGKRQNKSINIKVNKINNISTLNESIYSKSEESKQSNNNIIVVILEKLAPSEQKDLDFLDLRNKVNSALEGYKITQIRKSVKGNLVVQIIIDFMI